MLEALIIMGLTAAGGGWLATSEFLADEDERDTHVDSVQETEHDAPEEEAGDFLASLFDANEPDAVATCSAGQCLDNFDPASGPLLIQPPVGFDATDAEVSLDYDPHFHETNITVTAPDGESFDLAVSGVTPDDFGPENLMLAA